MESIHSENYCCNNLPGGGGGGGGVVVRGQGTGIWVQVTLPSAIHELRKREVCSTFLNCYSLTKRERRGRGGGLPDKYQFVCIHSKSLWHVNGI